MSRFFLLMLVCNTCLAGGFNVFSGVNQTFGMQFRDEQKYALPRITQTVKSKVSLDANSISIAFTNFNAGNNWYRLYENYYLYGVDVSLNSYLGGWKIEAFSDPNLEPEINKMYQEYDLSPASLTFNHLLPILGCYTKNPLRYGDVTGDGAMELAIYAQDRYGALNMSLFSTNLKKVIFSNRIASYDAHINDRLVREEGEIESASSPLANAPTDGQYLSRIAEDNARMITGIENSIIGFSKIYLDDMDGDNVQDLVEWRKLYKSRENKDPIKGFEKIRDTFIHYKLINGEYQKQATPEETIKSWLAAKQLTWQKGYPSKSECPGQEGQLIPEMHDPLLNDPDVLH